MKDQLKNIMEAKEILDEHYIKRIELLAAVTQGFKVIDSSLVAPDEIMVLVGKDIYEELQRRSKLTKNTGDI